MIGKKAFWIGLVLGLAALILLFASPASGFWWVLFVFSGALTAPRKSEHESTKDVSNIALTVAFFAVAVLFALFLIPDAVWTRFHLRVPAWGYGRTHEPEAVPLWARIGLVAFWSVVTWRRFRQLKIQHTPNAIDLNVG